MKNIKDKKNYLILCVSFVLVFIAICFFYVNRLLKGTNAAFGNGCITACLDANILVKFLDNYPDGFDSVDSIEVLTCDKYIIPLNKFDTPRKYEFIGWNTKEDGTGNDYKVSSCVTLSDDITLYAQWKELVIDYGDLNLDSNINNDDYLLLEKHLNGVSLLNDELLLSADVNDDTKVDNIDLDIIKHVNLGTLGYMGYLPNKIVPIYELYKSDNNNVMSPGSNGHVSGNGTGNGGTGNSSIGNGGSNTKPNAGTNKTNNNVSNNIVDEKKDVIESKTYNFRFMVDDIEYYNSSCTTKNSNNCKLVLPKIEPSKKGYKFNGWNVDKTCPNNVGINYSVLMEDDATYYACFLETEEENNIYGIIFVGFLIVIVWIFASYGIYYLIKRFKKRYDSELE